ncbi:Uncharacterised protein [Moraxella lacunata]|nr:Uncharacterised protein [Moraxella lacunata]
MSFAHIALANTDIAGVYSHHGEGVIHKHYLFENGDYCQELGSYGFIGVWAGHWHLQNQADDKVLNTTQKSFFNTLFPAWFDKEKTVTSPQIVIDTSNFTKMTYYGIEGVQAVLGFSENEHLNHAKLIYPTLDYTSTPLKSQEYRLNIPTSANYVFIGQKEEYNKDYHMVRYSLDKIKKGKHDLYVGLDPSHHFLLTSPPHTLILKDDKIIHTTKFNTTEYYKSQFDNDTRYYFKGVELDKKSIERLDDYHQNPDLYEMLFHDNEDPYSLAMRELYEKNKSADELLKDGSITVLKNEKEYIIHTCLNPIYHHDKDNGTYFEKMIQPMYFDKNTQLLTPTNFIWQGNIDKDTWYQTK